MFVTSDPTDPDDDSFPDYSSTMVYTLFITEYPWTRYNCRSIISSIRLADVYGTLNTGCAVDGGCRKICPARGAGKSLSIQFKSHQSRSQ